MRKMAVSRHSVLIGRPGFKKVSRSLDYCDEERAPFRAGVGHLLDAITLIGFALSKNANYWSTF
jgi:hypothetical protein